MAIALINKQKHKEKFRLVSNPKIVVLGLVHEPPEEIRYSSNSVIRMVEVAGNAYDILGQQIQSVGRSKIIYLCGSFMLYRNDKTYRCYEVTHQGLQWTRQKKKIHPVTKLETGEFVYEEIGKVNICIQFDTKPPFSSDNPTQFGYIYSTDELKAGDIVGEFLIRETRKQYDMYTCRFEYQVVQPNGL